MTTLSKNLDRAVRDFNAGRLIPAEDPLLADFLNGPVPPSILAAFEEAKAAAKEANR